MVAEPAASGSTPLVADSADQLRHVDLQCCAENEEGMTEDEKAIARFQRQRMKELAGVARHALLVSAHRAVAMLARPAPRHGLMLTPMCTAGRKFQLDDDNDADEDPLTHMGASLADIDFSQQVQGLCSQSAC